jgi:hypothetical protein
VDADDDNKISARYRRKRNPHARFDYFFEREFFLSLDEHALDRFHCRLTGWMMCYRSCPYFPLKENPSNSQTNRSQNDHHIHRHINTEKMIWSLHITLFVAEDSYLLSCEIESSGASCGKLTSSRMIVPVFVVLTMLF